VEEQNQEILRYQVFTPLREKDFHHHHHHPSSIIHHHHHPSSSSFILSFILSLMYVTFAFDTLSYVVWIQTKLGETETAKSELEVQVKELQNKLETILTNVMHMNSQKSIVIPSGKYITSKSIN